MSSHPKRTLPDYNTFLSRVRDSRSMRQGDRVFVAKNGGVFAKGQHRLPAETSSQSMRDV